MNKPFSNQDRSEILKEHTINIGNNELVDSQTTRLVRDSSCNPASEQELLRGVADLGKCFYVSTTYTSYIYPAEGFQGPPSQTEVTENNAIGVNEKVARATFDALTR